MRTGYVDVQARDLDEALALIEESCRSKTPRSVALLGNAADVFAELYARGVRPDCVTDQTSATTPSTATCRRAGRWPSGTPSARATRPGSQRRRKRSMAAHVRAMLDFHRAGVPTVDYGKQHPQMALEEGVADAFAFPGFVPAYIRPLFCRGVGPFRWCPVGRPEDIFATDAKVKELLPGQPPPAPLARHGPRADPVPGPAGADLLGGLGDRHRLGLALTRWCATAS